METTEGRTSDIGGREDLPAFKLVLRCPSGLSPPEISVTFDRKYDRIPHPDTSFENSISEIWDRRVQENPSLFNGLKFRYGGHARVDSSGRTNVCLHLGLTDYRTFVGTNLNPLWEAFLLPSDEDDQRRCRHTSNPLGNGAIVETSEYLMEMLLCCKEVPMSASFLDTLFFPEAIQRLQPQEVGIISHFSDEELSNNQRINKKVSEEMFDSIIREVVEEIGVPATSLDKPVFIGISERVLNVRPTAFFVIKCGLRSEEIKHLYSSAQDGYESTGLYTMSVSNLEDIAFKMPGCHQGGFALYKLMVEAAKEK